MDFLTFTWRRILREKWFATACILSLALGIAGAILVSLYLYSELSFDHYHVNHERIYSISTGLSGTELGQAGYEVGPVIVDNFPQYLDYVRFREADEQLFSYGQVNGEWEDVHLVDSSVFKVFTFDVLQG